VGIITIYGHVTEQRPWLSCHKAESIRPKTYILPCSHDYFTSSL